MFLSTKFSTKKFHLVSKYANYPTWDEKQNAPLKQITFIFQYLFFQKYNEEYNEETMKL